MEATQPPGSMSGDLIISVSFIVMGSLLTIASLKSLKAAWAMQSWPSTRGEIRSSRIELTGDGFYKPAIEYTFVIDDRQIAGKRRTLFERATNNRVWADTVVARYPIGSSVMVYYDPNDPRQCVVDRENTRTFGTILTIIGLSISAFGFAALRSVP